jgi:anti-sigma factor RsiW
LARHSEYLDGRLDAIAAEEVRDHLASCPRCARYDRVLRRGVKILAAQPPIEPTPDFAFQLQRRLEFEQRHAALQPMRSMATASVAVAAMLALAAWIPVLMMATEEREALSAVQTAEASPVSAEIAWHGAPAVDEEAHAHIHLVTRGGWQPSAEHHPIAPRYTPVVVGSPTEPINYSYASYSE